MFGKNKKEEPKKEQSEIDAENSEARLDEERERMEEKERLKKWKNYVVPISSLTCGEISLIIDILKKQYPRSTPSKYLSERPYIKTTPWPRNENEEIMKNIFKKIKHDYLVEVDKLDEGWTMEGTYHINKRNKNL